MRRGSITSGSRTSCRSSVAFRRTRSRSSSRAATTSITRLASCWRRSPPSSATAAGWGAEPMADRRWGRPRAISRLTTLVAMLLVATAAPSAAQSIEVVPFGGYRVGGSAAAGSPYQAVVYDAGGGVSFGAIVDVPYGPPRDGLKLEALLSQGSSWIEGEGPSLFDPKTRVDISVEHLMVGGVQELDSAPGRAFIGGLFGLSRYAAPDEVDVRVTIGLSAGAKFFANRHVGLRIDARGYMTIVSIGGTA